MNDFGFCGYDVMNVFFCYLLKWCIFDGEFMVWNKFRD